MKTDQTRAASNGSPAVSPATDATLIPPEPAARRRCKRWSSVALGVAIAAGGGAAYWYLAGSGTPLPYRTARVQRRGITASVSATRNLNAVIMVLVGSRVSGTIKELSADVKAAPSTVLDQAAQSFRL